MSSVGISTLEHLLRPCDHVADDNQRKHGHARHQPPARAGDIVRNEGAQRLRHRARWHEGVEPCRRIAVPVGLIGAAHIYEQRHSPAYNRAGEPRDDFPRHAQHDERRHEQQPGEDDARMGEYAQPADGDESENPRPYERPRLRLLHRGSDFGRGFRSGCRCGGLRPPPSLVIRRGPRLVPPPTVGQGVTQTQRDIQPIRQKRGRQSVGVQRTAGEHQERVTRRGDG